MYIKPESTIAKLESLDFKEEAVFFRNLIAKSKNSRNNISNQIPIFQNFNQNKPTNEFSKTFKTALQRRREQKLMSMIVNKNNLNYFKEAFGHKKTVLFEKVNWEQLRNNVNDQNFYYLSDSFLSYFRNGDKFNASAYLDFLQLLERVLESLLYTDSLQLPLDGVISEQNVIEFITILIPQIKSLENMGQHIDYYIPYATTILMNYLTPFDGSNIFFSRFLCSKVFLQFISLDTGVKLGKNPFRLEESRNAYRMFVQLDTKKIGYLSAQDIKKFGIFHFTDAFLERLFNYVMIASSVDDNKLEYTLFLNLFVALKNMRTRRSVDLFFHVADIDGDGVLSNFDIIYFYKEMIKESSVEDHSYDPFLCELLDLTKSKASITKEQIYKSRSGDQIFLLLFDINTFKKWEETSDN